MLLSDRTSGISNSSILRYSDESDMPELFGGQLLVLIGFGEHGLDVRLLIGPQGITQIVASGRRQCHLLLQGARQITQRDPFTVTENHGVLDDVVELADVALPRQ